MATGDSGGSSIASVGGVNGDGFADLIVGAYGADPHGDRSGASYVVFGKASGFAANIDLSNLDGGNGFRILGETLGDNSGYSVASAGDVNADGFADLIVGARTAGPQAGASYVIHGRAPDSAVNRVGTDASQTLAGGGFDDTLSALGGDDRLHGNGGNDTLDGGLGDDTSYGGDGDDLLRGREGNDVLSGGAGDDEILGAEGNDAVDGGTGNDTVAGGEGNDTLDGGKGIDTVRYASASAGVTMDLGRARAQDTGGAGIDTLSNIENAIGSGFDDRLWGTGKANILIGGDGDDLLIGRKGDDTLAGGGGADSLTGGDGDDTFVFDAVLVAGAITTITDLVAGADEIALSRAVFTAVGAAGPLAAGAFFVGAAAHDAGDRVVYNSVTGDLLYDPDGTGAQTATHFATLTPGLALSAGDFVVF